MLLVICSGVLVTGDVPAAAWTVFFSFLSSLFSSETNWRAQEGVVDTQPGLPVGAADLCSREALILLVRPISDWSEMDDVTAPSQHQATALASSVDSLSHY